MTSILCAALLLADQGPVSKNFAFQSELKTIVVFREGFGFYIREGAAVLENGWATTNLVPDALAGTFWVYPKNPADRVDTIVLTHNNDIPFSSPKEIEPALKDKIGLALRVRTATAEN